MQLVVESIHILQPNRLQNHLSTTEEEEKEARSTCILVPRNSDCRIVWSLCSQVPVDSVTSNAQICPTEGKKNEPNRMSCNFWTKDLHVIRFQMKRTVNVPVP